MIQKAKIKQSFAKYKQRSGNLTAASRSETRAGGKGKGKSSSTSSDGFFEQDSYSADVITDDEAHDVQLDKGDEDVEATQFGRFVPQGSDDLLEQASQSALRKSRARAGPPPTEEKGSEQDDVDHDEDDATESAPVTTATKTGVKPDLRHKTPKKHLPRKALPVETGNARRVRLEPKIWKTTEEQQRERQTAQVKREKQRELWNRTSSSQRGRARGQPDLGARVKVLLQRIKRDVGADGMGGAGTARR